MPLNTQTKQNQKASNWINEITHLFWSSVGSDAIKNILVMVYPQILKDLTYGEISTIIKRNVRPKQKLVIVERTKFSETKQNPNKTVIQYLHWLKEATRYWEFEKLASTKMSIDE